MPRREGIALTGEAPYSLNLAGDGFEELMLLADFGSFFGDIS